MQSRVCKFLTKQLTGGKIIASLNRTGHAAIVFRLLRVEHPLNPTKILNLSHHILKAKLLKVLQPLSLLSSCLDFSSALCSPINLHYTNLKVSKLLLQCGASPNSLVCPQGKSLLEFCASEGKLELLILLLDFGVDICSQNEEGDTTMHHACRNGQLNVVEFLVQKQPPLLMLPNFGGEFPLTSASLKQKIEVVTFLLEILKETEQGAHVILQALMSSSASDCPDIVQLILQKFKGQKLLGKS